MRSLWLAACGGSAVSTLTQAADGSPQPYVRLVSVPLLRDDLNGSRRPPRLDQLRALDVHETLQLNSIVSTVSVNRCDVCLPIHDSVDQWMRYR